MTPWTVACQAPLSMGFSRQEYWSGCHFLLQGICPTQGLNLGLLHCRQMLCPLSHLGSPCTHPNPISNPSIDTLLKNSSSGLQGLGHKVFLDRSPLCPPLPGKVISPVLFYFIQNCVSKIQFSSGVLYRKAELSATVFSKTHFFKYFITLSLP